MRKIANLKKRGEWRKDSPGLCSQSLFQLTIHVYVFQLIHCLWGAWPLAIKRGLRSPGKLKGLINNILHFTHGDQQNADLSSVLSWTSSTMIWLAPGKLDSPSKRRKRIPVVQYNKRVSADWKYDKIHETLQHINEI